MIAITLPPHLSFDIEHLDVINLEDVAMKVKKKAVFEIAAGEL